MTLKVKLSKTIVQKKLKQISWVEMYCWELQNKERRVIMLNLNTKVKGIFFLSLIA